MRVLERAVSRQATAPPQYVSMASIITLGNAAVEKPTEEMGARKLVELMIKGGGAKTVCSNACETLGKIA